MSKFVSVLVSQVVQRKNVELAVESSLKHISTSMAEAVHFCCCYHDHDADCPWLVYREKMREQGTEEKACLLHNPMENCGCDDKDRKDHIDHLETCLLYRNFHHKLQSMKSKYDQLTYPKNGYMPPSNSPPFKMYKLCCCRWDVLHQETQKFIYLTDKSNCHIKFPEGQLVEKK